MIIDDDPTDIRLLVRAHQRAGLDRPLVAVNTPSELFATLEEAASQPERWPCALIVDVRMPLMDGFTLVDRVRERFSRPLPMVMFTTSPHPSDQARAQVRDVPLRIKPDSGRELEAFLRDVATHAPKSHAP